MNILQTGVFFSLLMLSVSIGFNKLVVDVIIAKSEAVKVLGFED